MCERKKLKNLIMRKNYERHQVNFYILLRGQIQSLAIAVIKERTQ